MTSKPLAVLPFALCLGLASLTSAHAQDHVDIEQRLSAEQLRATGLDRLTADELALLNRLLREERSPSESEAAVARAGLRGPARSEAAASAMPDRFESTIQGEFRGWSPGTTLTLANGQRWRVTDGSLHTRRVAAPKVTVARSAMGAWFLKVEGYGSRAKVSRVD